MLSVIMLSVIMLSVVMLSVIMLSVMAPKKGFYDNDVSMFHLGGFLSPLMLLAKRPLAR
jgi:hypothetical protein